MAEHDLNKIVDDSGEVFNLRDTTKQPTADRVTSWSSTTSDTKYPSEKLVKDSLDAKAPNAPSEVTIANGDKIVIADSSDSNKVKRSGVAFDGSTTSQFLTKKGTFEKVKEADVSWGGDFRAGELSPVEFGNMARNLILNPTTTAVTFEKTTDGGTTWTAQNMSDALKRALCNIAGSGAGANFGIPKTAYEGVSDPSLLKGRITIYAISSPSVDTPEDTWFYGIVKRFFVKVSRNGNAYMKVEYQTWTHFIASDNVWVDSGTFNVQGDTGWNSIPFENTIGGFSGQLASGRIIAVRFTFWIESATSNPRVAVVQIGFLPQIHWTSKAGNSPLLGVPIIVHDEGVGRIEMANKLYNARKLAVSLSNTSTDTSFNGTADVTNIKTTGTLGVGNGGTGKTTAKAAEYNLTTGKSEISDATSGDDRVVFELASPSESNGVTRGFRKLSTIWTWIKGQISSVLGLSENGYTGNAATATALSAGADKIKLDGIEDNANNYVHPTSGANTSKGDTTAQTPSFGQTFKVLSATVDAMGHTTALAEHTVKIPDSVAEGGPGGNSGLMSYQDKDKLDGISSGANKVEASTNNGNIKIDGVDTTVYTHPTHTGYNNMGTSTKVAKISVDTKGHVTNISEIDIDYSSRVAKAGDTMSGNLTISKGANQGDTKFVASRTDTGTTGWFGVGDGGQNHGVYSDVAALNTNNDVDSGTKGWVVRTDDSGYSYLTGAVDGLFSKNFGATETLRGMKRLRFGYSLDREGDYTHVSATAIIEARLYSAGVSGGTITMLFNASARGDVGSYYRLQVLSYNNWNLNSVCPVLITQNVSATAKYMYLALVSGGPTSTTLRTFSYSEVKILPLNGTNKFNWSFSWDTNDFNSNTMTMIKPYVYPRAQIGTAIGDAGTPVYVKADGDFGTASGTDVAIALKDAGRADAPVTQDWRVKVGWGGSGVDACAPNGTSTYSAGQTVGTTKHLVTAYEYDGIGYYKDVQAGAVTVGNSEKWNGFSLAVQNPSSSPAANTLYIF